MTIANRLRQIAEDSFPGHATGHTHWDACGGCKIDALANELERIGREAKANGLIWVADALGGADHKLWPQQVSSDYLGADRE